MADRVVKYVLRGDISQFAASMKAAGASTKKLANDLTSADKSAARSRQSLSTLGSSAMTAGLVVAAGAGLAVKAAIDWESAWAGVTKTVDGSAAQMAALEEGLRGLATTLPATHQEIAGIAEAAGQLGVAQGDILGFTRTMVDLSETTNLSAEEAATSIAQFMNVMQTAPQDVDNLGSALVALGNDGASTERDIIQMAQNIAGAGAIIGASEADILALANALASVGIDAEAGGSAVSKILIDMSTAVQTNSKSLKTWAAVSGQTTAEFAQNFSDDPVRAFDAFTQGLGRINAEGGDVFSLLQGLGQSDIRVTRAMLGMAKSGDLLSNSLATGSAEWERNTALADEAAKRYDTAAAKSQIAWNGIKDSAIDAGNAMLPVVTAIAEAVSSITSAFGALPGPVKSSAGVLAAVAGVSLLAAGALSKLTVSVAANRAAMASLAIQAPKTGAAIGLLSKALGVAAAAFAAASVLSNLDKMDVSGVNKFTRGLLEAADGSDKLINSLTSVGSSGPLGWNRNSIDGLADAFDNAAEARGKMDLSFGHESEWERGAEFVKQIDAALTSMVQSGATEDAARAFAFLREETGKSAKELLKLLPGYEDGIEGVKNAAAKGGPAVDKFGVALEQLTPEAKAAQEAQDALRESTRETALSFLDFSENLDTSKVSLGEYIKELEANAKAQADWAENVIKATAKGLNPEFIKGLREQGPEGAKRLAELADASEKEIARINAAFDNLDANGQKLADVMAEVPAEVLTEFSTIGGPDAVQMATNLATKYNLTPDQVETIMRALDFASKDIAEVKARLLNVARIKAMPTIGVTDAATGKVRQIQQYIDGMRGKTVRIAVVGGAPGGITANADGNLYPAGHRVVAFADGTENHVAQIGDGRVTRVWNEPETEGEAYIPFAQSKRKRSQQIAMETVSRLGGVAHFADGGTHRAGTAPQGLDSGALAHALATATERAVSKSLQGAVFYMADNGSIRIKKMGG